ncbi:YihY/virulence factor BrkB family protein [Cryobacterium adonitolivorans]|uniref:YihY/virulence factor BrkB family protein n=1 Tax=Cryobacterium adonitolivorans TaxID=1259189 RepID=A0A4V3IDA1_9MICO|nr:YihY/virulence factor BrkB family protein [Cryobacterium adonitolivorans]TFC05594.1 YihY/virulence factor BrkB family protein [Cryobacterium adonitolivorans]
MASNETHEKKDHAPSPDDSRKPDSPGEVSKPSWKYAIRKTFREFSADQCTDIAASLTYYAVLALFPALIALMSLLGVLGQGERSVDTILNLVNQVAPGGTADMLREPLAQFSSSPAAGFALVFGIVLAIWSASGYVGAFSRAMNRIYEIEEGRPFWKLRPMQLFVTIVSILLILIMLVILIVSGPVTDAVGSALGLGETVQIVWSIVKWPILALAAVLIIAILYYATPNAKQPKFRWISLGALLALITLVIASFLFGLYITNFSNYDRTYGSLAGVIVFLLWLWIANLALLFGAEFDAELERGRQLQAGIAAEEDIQLPPRDTRKSDKAAEKDRADVATGRRLREESGEGRDTD